MQIFPAKAQTISLASRPPCRRPSYQPAHIEDPPLLGPRRRRVPKTPCTGRSNLSFYSQPPGLTQRIPQPRTQAYFVNERALLISPDTREWGRLFARRILGNPSTSTEMRCQALFVQVPSLRLMSPQKALRGGIWWTFLEPFGRLCQLLAEKCSGCLKDVWKLTFEYLHKGLGVDPLGGPRKIYSTQNMGSCPATLYQKILQSQLARKSTCPLKLGQVDLSEDSVDHRVVRWCSLSTRKPHSCKKLMPAL